jgi:Lon protease-like protein
MAEEKFLAFKGLKQYDPGMGWAQVHQFGDASTENEETLAIPQAASEVLHDPLLGELFEQLNRPAQDDLAQNWKVIAGSVSLLSQRMNQQRELRKRLSTIDVELDALRNTILKDLQEIQRSADQQLSMARLRAEVSSLAQARLASRLRNSPP